MFFDIIRNVFWIFVTQVRKLFNWGREEEMKTWDSLPWEMQGAVMRQMDIVTRGQFQLASHHSAAIVRYFGKRTPVTLKIKHSYQKQFEIAVTCDKGGQLNWKVQAKRYVFVFEECYSESAVFVHYKAEDQMLNVERFENRRIEDVAWEIVEKILKSSEYNIHTVHLELRWHEYIIKPTVVFNKLKTLHLKNSFLVTELQAVLTHFNEIPDNVIVEQFPGCIYNISLALLSPVIQYAENLKLIHVGQYSDADLLYIENRTLTIRENRITPAGINGFIKKLLSQNHTTIHLWERIFMIEGDFADHTKIIGSGVYYDWSPSPTATSMIFGFFTNIISCSKIYVIFAEDAVILFDADKFDDRDPEWEKGLEMYMKKSDRS